MPKFDKRVVIIGDQRPMPDVVSMARLLVQFARQQEAKLARRQQPDTAATPESGAAA